MIGHNLERHKPVYIRVYNCQSTETEMWGGTEKWQEINPCVQNRHQTHEDRRKYKEVQLM